MQIQVEQSGAIERKLTVSIPHAEVDREIEKRLRQVARGARIPGFRPGKAPQHLIAKRYGGQVTNEVISDTINASYREALGREDIAVAGLVSLEPKPFVAGDDLQYVATVELFPDIPALTLAGRTIEKPVCEVADEDVERALQNIRRRKAVFFDRPAKPDAAAAEAEARDGDRLTVDFSGTIDGKPFSGGTGKAHQFILGDGAMLEAFESGLRGARAGEAKTIALTFPDDYPGREVAGKAAEFAVTVTAVARPQLPELDDAFAADLGVAEGGLAKLRENIRDTLAAGAAVRADKLLRDRAMDALVEANPIEAPSVLVEAEIDRVMQALSPAARREIPRDTLRAGATRQVIIGLVLREVIAKHDLKPDAEAVRRKIERLAAAEGVDGSAEDIVNWYYADAERMRSLESAVLEEMVIERMLATATVVEKPLSFAQMTDAELR